MYFTLLTIHSLFRWLVLISLFYAIYTAYKGYITNSSFTKTNNSVRHWTATITHIQFALGTILYVISPVVKYLWKNFGTAMHQQEPAFFGAIHFTLMMGAVTVLSIGSAKAKRKTNDKEKFKTMLIWFSIALIIILVAIPWPFSPLANRPYFRGI